MTDKGIIDGVDVRECEHQNYEHCEIDYDECKISEKYKRVLDEIEKYFKSKDKRKTSLFNIFVIEQEILNIINKTKETNNAR